MRDQLHGDDPRQLRAETILGKHSQGPEILRVQLTGSLTSGGNATCKVLDFTGATWAMSTRQYTLYDSLNRVTGVSGDKLWAVWNVDSRRLEALGPIGAGGIPIYNDAGEQIPAYSQVYPSGLEISGSSYWIKVKKPSSVVPRDWFVTGIDPIEDAQHGTAQAGPLFVCKYESGTPVRGEHWWPLDGQYTLQDAFDTAKDYYQNYNVLGVLDAGSKLLLATQKPFKMFGGLNSASTQTTSSISSGTEVTVSLPGKSGQGKCGVDCDSATYKLTVEVSGMYRINGGFDASATSLGAATFIDFRGVIYGGGFDLRAYSSVTLAGMRAHLEMGGHYYLEVGDEVFMTFMPNNSIGSTTYGIDNAHLAISQI